MDNNLNVLPDIAEIGQSVQIKKHTVLKLKMVYIFMNQSFLKMVNQEMLMHMTLNIVLID